MGLRKAIGLEKLISKIVSKLSRHLSEVCEVFYREVDEILTDDVITLLT